jgi:anti-sigma factor RsiW
MTNERGRRLMHEALDDRLGVEAQQELRSRLETDPQEAFEYERLRAVDEMLKSAPFERAPQYLAVRIMARLADELQRGRLNPLSGTALAVGLALGTLTLLPLLVSAVYLLVTAVGSATFFNSVLQFITGVASVGAAAILGLVESAQALISGSPILPVGLLILIPVGVVWLARLSRQRPASEQKS